MGAPAGETKMPIKFLAALATAALALALPAAAADSYPTRPVRLLVPTPPGNALDIGARMLAEGLAARWKQNAYVDNKAGGAGVPAMLEGKNAAPDGYTIIVAPSSTAGINPGLYPNLPYAPLKDFEAVSGIYLGPVLLVTRPGTSYRTLKDVLDVARKEPGQLQIAIAGPLGTTQHLSMELFADRAGIKVQGVPYKGSGPALQDLLGGHTDLLFDSVASAIPHIKAGTVKPIAVATLERMPQIPDVPTFAESGLPGFEAVSWGGLMVPKGTPPELVARIAADTRAVVEQPDMREKMLARGLIPDARGPKEWNDFIAAEIAKWSALIKAANIKPE